MRRGAWERTAPCVKRLWGRDGANSADDGDMAAGLEQSHHITQPVRRLPSHEALEQRSMQSGYLLKGKGGVV